MFNRVLNTPQYFLVNPFVPNAPFLYPLKTSENRKIFWCFQGMEKGGIGKEWANNPWDTEILPNLTDNGNFTSVTC